ncbi:MAG: type I DNA topoisomerase [Candidatus Kerfeldbacteria bacterium]|nr:type I DNA topoisomerase [Candidatus Kerfeldbacteria bacterium]
MNNSLIIVESPTKAKTIGRFLGNGYKVLSSFGHVRDLPKSKLGIEVDNDFKPEYQVIAKAKVPLAALKQALKQADNVYLATDEDREGEAISWHLAEVLKLKPENSQRIVFHEITPEAIKTALDSPRPIDKNLVQAQEARRLLDRLYGYSVSPLLWQKIKVGLSAGRVQSVATRLLVERERERLNFKTSEYWDIVATLATGRGEEFTAQLISLNEQPIATGKDFVDQTGELKNQKIIWLKQAEATQLITDWAGAPAAVQSVETKPFTEKPLAPFTTSTLQQEANRKLRYSARRTMQQAQDLYENGYITYMRTDSTLLSEQAISAARGWINEQYGQEYLSPGVRQYQTKVKNAQEAHEAIRPAGANFKPLDQVKQEVSEDAYRLYELIWKRTVASQMADCTGERRTILIAIKQALFRASGKTIKFEGYRRAYVEGADDVETELSEQEKLLPNLNQGDKLKVINFTPKGHFTLPPARLTEAALVKELETRGIGRPSTYASIIDTIERREYVVKKGTTLIPTFTAFAVVNLMEKYLGNLVDYSFTAKMEDELDEIASGNINDKTYLKKFYFGQNSQGLEPILKNAKSLIDPRETSGVPLGEHEGKIIEVRIGRFGPFIKWDGQTTRLPDDIAPDELTITKALELLKQGNIEPKVLGTDPTTGQNIYFKTGRFGPYVQLGESPNGDDKIPKPKMASLLKTMTPETLTLAEALELLALPRKLGRDPKTGEDILASNGRFGPYVKRGSDFRSLPVNFDLLKITLEQALELLAQEKKSSRRTAETVKELGQNPGDSKIIKLMNGRYGMYVTDGNTNATLPKDLTADSITLAKALELIKEREGKPTKRRLVRRKGKSE